MPVLVVVIAGVIVLIAAMWGQRSLRIRLRSRRLKQGTTNEQVLLRWQETVKLARLLEQLPDENLFSLAQKAKYSNHSIIEEELALFDAYAKDAKEQLRQHPFFKRLYYRLILAVY